MNITFKDNFQEIAEKWKNKPTEFFNGLAKGFRMGLREYAGYLEKEQLSGRKSGNYGLNRQSGTAAMSLNSLVSYDGEDLIGRITVNKNAWYLKLHQHHDFDGTAIAKGNSSFAVPVHPDAKGRKPSDFDLGFIKLPGRNPILIRKIFRGGSKRGGASEAGQKLLREDIMFVLTKKVFIPKRLYFYEDFKTIGNNMIGNQIMIQLKSLSKG